MMQMSSLFLKYNQHVEDDKKEVIVVKDVRVQHSYIINIRTYVTHVIGHYNLDFYIVNVVLGVQLNINSK